ncbi:MAG: hypothetical protein ABIX46_08875, partial [Burkholderiaceae bacterium]
MDRRSADRLSDRSADRSAERSERLHGHQPAAPAASARGGLHARFIPREELAAFEAWSPGALGAAVPQPGASVNRGAS